MRMPWNHLKRWWDVYQKRKRRELKIETNLHGMGMMATMGGMVGRAAPPPPEDVINETQIAALAAQGFAVEYRTPSE